MGYKVKVKINTSFCEYFNADRYRTKKWTKGDIAFIPSDKEGIPLSQFWQLRFRDMEKDNSIEILENAKEYKPEELQKMQVAMGEVTGEIKEKIILPKEEFKPEITKEEKTEKSEKEHKTKKETKEHKVESESKSKDKK